MTDWMNYSAECWGFPPWTPEDEAKERAIERALDHLDEDEK